MKILFFKGKINQLKLIIKNYYFLKIFKIVRAPYLKILKSERFIDDKDMIYSDIVDIKSS